MRALPRLLSFTFIAAAATFTLACSSITEKVSEEVSEKVSEKTAEIVLEANNKDAKVDINGGKVEITTPEGQFKMGEGSSAFNTPSGFPEGVEPYPGAVIFTSMAGSSAQGSGGMLGFHTTDSPDKVVAFYKAKTEGKYPNKTEATQNGAATLALSGAEGKGGFLVSASPRAEGGSEVMLTIQVPHAQ